MIRFQADADLNHNLVIGIRKREPALDFSSAADIGLEGLDDDQVLEIAARQQRILITHDLRTMPGHFCDRLAAGKSSAGVFIVSQYEPIGPVVEVVTMIWAASEVEEWRDRIHHLPSLLRHILPR